MAEILRRALGLLVGNGASKVLLLGAELYLALQLGAGSYGLFAVCLAVLLVAGHVSLLGMDFGIVKFLATYQEQRRPDRIAGLLRWSLGMVAGTGALAALFVVLASHAIARSVFGKPELGTALMLVGLAIPFEALNQCMAAIFRGVRRVPEQVLVSDLVRNIVLVASLAIAPWMRLDLEYLAAALLVGTLASFATGIVVLARHFRGLPAPSPARAIAGDLLAFSWPLFVWNIFQTLAGRVQVLIAAVFLSSTDVGVLALLFRVVLVFNFVQTAMNHAAPVEFARLSHLADHAGLRRLFLRLSQVLLAISILLALPIVIEPTVALRAFGGQYAEAAPLLLWLAVSHVLEVGSGPVGHLLINTGHQRALVVVVMAGSIIQLCAGVLLMRLYGLSGAVAAEVATATFLMVTRHALSSRLLGIHAFTPRFFGLLALGAASALVGVGMLRIEGVAVPYWAALATAVLVYGALLRWIFLGGPAGRADFARVARDVWRRPARTDLRRRRRVEEGPVIVAEREISR